MVQVNIHEAKAKLSQLLAGVQASEEVISARAGHLIARISGIKHRAGDAYWDRMPGCSKFRMISTRSCRRIFCVSLSGDFSQLK